MYWTYSALTRSGQEVSAALKGSRQDVLDHLALRQLSVIQMSPDHLRTLGQFLPRRKLSSLAMAVFFEDLSNMLQTGMSLSQIILIIKETTREAPVRDLLFQLEEDLQKGQSLTEALAGLKAFPWIVPVTLAAAERTGRLGESAAILGKYFRHYNQVQDKLAQALIYPSIVFVLLLCVMFFVSLRVIPQLKNLLPVDSLQHQSTQWVLIFSSFLQQYLWVGGVVACVGIIGACFFRSKEPYRFMAWTYQWPLLGPVLKESAFALYLFNLSVLIKSGTPLIKAIGDLNALDPTLVAHHFSLSREYMLGGSSFWQAIEQDEFFPLIIAATLRRAEEIARLDDYCLSLAEFFNKQARAKVDGSLQLIQPALLVAGAVFLVSIATAFLLPIYGSLSVIAGGQ